MDIWKPVIWKMLLVLLVTLLLLPSVGNICAEEVPQDTWEKAFNKWDGTRENWSVPQRALNGVDFPAEYRDLRVIAVAHRQGSESIKVILGNDIAVTAARAKQTAPWPDGTLLVKVVWKHRQLPSEEGSIAPAQLWFIGAMRKHSQKYKDTLGWEFAMWEGGDLIPYGSDEHVAQECVGCHAPLTETDFVFTVPAILP